jgi:hypothetical protein
MTSPRTIVSLTRDIPPPGNDPNVALYNSIRNSSENLSFNTYSAFLTALFCGDTRVIEHRVEMGDVTFRELLEMSSDAAINTFDCLGGTRAYDSLRRATETFVMMLAAPPETCRCWVRPRDREAAESSDELATARAAQDIVIEEIRTQDDDVADINRRYYPYEITPSHLRNLIWQLIREDPNLPAPSPGDRTRFLLPLMRRLRQNLRGVPMKGAAGDDCSGILRWRLECPPFLELIWNYWMEQGMLVQGINAISLRFQNQRRGTVDPLQRMDLTRLRPLSGLLWGYIQSEQDRLTIARRAYEYDHHYGLRLTGRSVPTLNPADSRPRFLEAFHNLLAESTRFYRLSMDTTVNPDTFPILNALKELHLILSEGAHNQFGDLPATARQEMLIQQWLIGRSEMRDYLGGRPSVVYPEGWMGHMDSLRQLYNWSDGSIRHYRDLAVFGERLLLSVRWADWTSETQSSAATSWLTFWRAEIQSYVHAYQQVTGVDLNTDQVRTVSPQLFTAQPTELILRRRAAQPLAIPAATTVVV